VCTYTHVHTHTHTHTLHPKPYAAQLEVQAIEDLQDEEEALGEYDDDAQNEAPPFAVECEEREGEEGEGAEGEGEEWDGEEGLGDDGQQRQRMADIAAKMGAAENSNELSFGSEAYLVLMCC